MKESISLARLFTALMATAVLALTAGTATAQAGGARKPNILVIWGDDIGQCNVSACNMGMMGCKTPNIDRIGREGAVFTDRYGQQSCTAGRDALVTGQSPIPTGLTKVGLPGTPEGMKKEEPENPDYPKGEAFRKQFGPRGVIHSFADGRIDAIGYQRWYLERMFAIAPAGAYVGRWLQRFREFPPRQKPGRFNLDRVMEAVMQGGGASGR
jgi:hypothetical protein